MSDLEQAGSIGASAGSIFAYKDISIDSFADVLDMATARYFSLIRNQRKRHKAINRMAKAIAEDSARMERVYGAGAPLNPGNLRVFLNETTTVALLDSVLNPRPAYQNESRVHCYEQWVETCDPIDAGDIDEKLLKDAFRCVGKQFDTIKDNFNVNEQQIIYRETEKQAIALFAIADRIVPERGTFLEYIKKLSKAYIAPENMGIFRYSRAKTPFSGRSAEISKLKEFCFSNKQLAWWSVSGRGGVGKSRLVYELCRDIRDHRGTWYSVFLPEAFFNSIDRFDRNWSLDRNLLAIVDYPNYNIWKIGAWLKRLIESDTVNRKIRLLILERDGPGDTYNNDDQDYYPIVSRLRAGKYFIDGRTGAAGPIWFQKLGATVGGRVLSNICHNRECMPLHLKPLDNADCLNIIEEYCKDRQDADGINLRIMKLWEKCDPGLNHLPILNIIIAAADDNPDVFECTDLWQLLDMLYECEIERIIAATGNAGRDDPVFIATIFSLVIADVISKAEPRSDCINGICAAAGLGRNSDEALKIIECVAKICRREDEGAAGSDANEATGGEADNAADIASGSAAGVNIGNTTDDNISNGVEGGVTSIADNAAADDTGITVADDIDGAATDDTKGATADETDSATVDNFDGAAQDDTDGATTDDADDTVADNAEDFVVSATMDVAGSDAEGSVREDSGSDAEKNTRGNVQDDVEYNAEKNAGGSDQNVAENEDEISEKNIGVDSVRADSVGADGVSVGYIAEGNIAADSVAEGNIAISTAISLLANKPANPQTGATSGPLLNTPITGLDIFSCYFAVKTLAVYGGYKGCGKYTVDIAWNRYAYSTANFIYRIIADQYYEYGIYDLQSCYDIIFKIPRRPGRTNAALYAELMVYLSAGLDIPGISDAALRLERLRGRGFSRDRHVAFRLLLLLYNLFLSQDWTGRKETVTLMDELRDQGFEYDKDMALILAQSMFILTAKQEEDGIKNTVARLESLRNQGFEQDRDITLELIKALLNLTTKQDAAGRKATVEHMLELRNQGFEQDRDITLELSKAMLNLTIKQEESGIEDTILLIENLRNQGFKRDKDIALIYAQALLNLTTKQDEAGVAKTVAKLEALRNQGFESDRDITRELSTALFNQTTRQDAAGIIKTVKRLDDIRNSGFTDDRDISLRLAQALFSLTTKPGAIVRKEASTRIDALRRHVYEQDREITLTLVKSLYNLTIEQDSEGTKETVTRIEEICAQGYSQDNEIKLLFAKSLFNLTTKLDENGIAETVSKLESLRNQK